MPRSFRELLDDFEADPARWEIIRTETVASTSVRNRGGTSTQELLRNKITGAELVRHTLRKPGGGLFAATHFRRTWT